MNATSGNSPLAEMRASDADRDAVLSDLSEHFQAGRLTQEEFEERAGRALAARTWGELRDLVRDLPDTLAGHHGPHWDHRLHRPYGAHGAHGAQAPVAAAFSAGRPERPSRHGAPAPIAVLVAIGIAVAVSVGIAHTFWVFMWVVLGLAIARRLIHHGGAPGRCR